MNPTYGWRMWSRIEGVRFTEGRGSGRYVAFSRLLRDLWGIFFATSGQRGLYVCYRLRLALVVWCAACVYI
jgi:hypothetical protein